MLAIRDMGSLAAAFVKQVFPVAGLTQKALSRKIGAYVKAIVGGNPTRPRTLTDRVVLLLIPVLIAEACLPEASQGVFKDVSGIMKGTLSATSVSAKAIKLMAKQRVKLNSLARYALFCLLYLAMNKRKQMAGLIKTERRDNGNTD